MTYLLQGFGAVIGCALVALGWTGYTTAINPKRMAKMPVASVKGGATALAVASIILAGFGASLLFAVMQWSGRR